MGGIVCAIGSVVGGVACAVGSVAEGVVCAAGAVVCAVASNPLIALTTLIAAPELGAFAAAADGAAAVDSASILAGVGSDLTGAGMMTAGVDTAIGGGTLTGIGGIAADSAGILGGSAITDTGSQIGGANLTGTGGIAPDVGTTLDTGTAGGWTPASTEFPPTAPDLTTSSLNVPDVNTAVQQGTDTLNASGGTLATDTTSQNVANNVVSQGGTIDQATHAVDAVNNGVSVNSAVTTATNGTVTSNPFTELWHAAKTGLSDISNAASSIQKTIGSTLLPGASPMLQNAASNFVINTALTGDPKAAALSAGIGVGSNLVGSTVQDVTGSNVLGNASKVATSGILSGRDPGTIALTTGITAGGTEIGNLTGSPGIGKIATMGANALVNPTSLGSSLINAAANVPSLLSSNQDLTPGNVACTLTRPNQLASITNSVLNSNNPNITANKIISQAPATVVPQQPQGGLPSTSNLPSATTTPPKVVPTNTLTPITNIASLSNILKTG
jgi:hypothetical protein